YRIIVQIVDDELVVATLEVGHRSAIYRIKAE
ncbi:type II toxin-antitoxin system RelE/ParE family toxin, partial [Streptococcus pneumoniae]